jgi:cytochrome P450
VEMSPEVWYVGSNSLIMKHPNISKGDIVRYAPKRLSVNNINGLKDIYRDGKDFAKPPEYRLLRHQAANTFTMINKKEHARRRRIIAPIVSDGAMRRLEPVMLVHIRKFLSLVSNTENYGLNTNSDTESLKEWTVARNMTNWAHYLTFDIMGDLIFGVKYNLIEDMASRYVFGAVDESNRRMSVLIHLPIIRSINSLDRFLFPQAIEARDKFLGFVSKLVEDCMNPKCEPIGRTLFSILSSSKDPVTGEGFSMKEIVAETTNLCVASVDTTSTAIAATFFYLSRNKAAYERAVKEVRSTFSSADDIGIGSDLNSCAYIRACIDESLRLAPPAGSCPFRQVQEGGAIVDDQYFQPGIELGVGIYSIHHNEEYFPEPFAFRPERWLVSESSSTSVKKAQSAFCAFSLGSRGCVGKSVAMTQLMLTMAITLFTLDFKCDDNDDSARFSRSDEFFVRDHITAVTNGPMINFRPR